MRLALAILASALGAVANAQDEGPQPPGGIVADGDFERHDLALGRGDTVQAWVARIHDAPDAAITMVDGEGRNGSRCVRFTRTGTESRNIHLDQLIPVTPETVYEVCAWVRSDGHLRPVLAVQTRSWQTLAWTVAAPLADWQQVRFLFHSREHEQVRFEWFPGATGALYTGVAGTSWLDGVSVAPLSPVPAAVQAAFELTRPKPAAEIDTASLRPGPIGERRPLHPIRCRDGVFVYEDGGEVALWGVNLQTALSWEWRGRLRPVGVPLEAEALKRVTDENLAQLQQLDVGILRLHLLPSDFTDGNGDLRDSVYLDVLDYLIARSSELGIYVYLTLVNEMNSVQFADSFIAGRERREWLFDPALVAATERYVRGLLLHGNRYTGLAYKDTPGIAVIEIMNEPAYLSYPEIETEPGLTRYRDAFGQWCTERGVTGAAGTVFATYRYELVRAYLERLCAAIRGTGSRQPIVWNLNWPGMVQQHEDVFQATADSPVDAVSFCCYPGQSDVPHPFWDHPTDLSGTNYLPYLRRCYREYGLLRWLLGQRFAGKAKVVYEFETFYNQTTYMYPAMAALFRSLGAQIAPMWQYTLSPVAEYLGGSHYLNLLCTPGKAVSFRIGAWVFSHTPRGTAYDTAAETEMTLGACVLSFSQDLSVLRTSDLFVHSRPVEGDAWKPAPTVTEVFGCGDSPLVSYAGSGSYLLRMAPDALDITIHPDVTYARPPWQRPPRRDPPPRLCLLDYAASHRFVLRLPAWQDRVEVRRLDGDRQVVVPSTGDPLAFEALSGRYRVVRLR